MKQDVTRGRHRSLTKALQSDLFCTRGRPWRLWLGALFEEQEALYWWDPLDMGLSNAPELLALGQHGTVIPLLCPHPVTQAVGEPGDLPQSCCRCSLGHQAAWALPANAQTEGTARLWGRWKRELIVNLELSVHAWMPRPEWLPQLRFRTCQVRKRRLFFPIFQYTLMFLLSPDSSVTVCHWKGLHCIHYRELVPKCNN